MRKITAFILVSIFLFCTSCTKGPGSGWECHLCGKIYERENPGTDVLYCPKCYSDSTVSRCVECGQHYEDFALSDGYCADCLQGYIEDIRGRAEEFDCEWILEGGPDDYLHCFECGILVVGEAYAYVEAIDEYLCGRCLRYKLDASGEDWGRLLTEE